KRNRVVPEKKSLHTPAVAPATAVPFLGDKKHHRKLAVPNLNRRRRLRRRQRFSVYIGVSVIIGYNFEKYKKKRSTSLRSTPKRQVFFYRLQ
ncbi:MAG: hypothetical protein IJO22_05645, partial [Oscillospiraceae bacterium]|nr:hypothetical protein [Oscillospiraceae bacterium]